MTDVSIRDLALHEADVVADFFGRWWRPDHIFSANRNLLLWLYHDNPYAAQFSDGLTFKAAFINGDLIGVFGYMPFVFNRYGERQFGCNLSAWWVHPDCRRGSTGLQLLDVLQNQMGFDACVAGINTPIAERIYERLGWVVMECLPRWVLPLHADQFRGLLAPAAARVYTGVVPGKEHILHPADRVAVEELRSFDELDATSWDRFYWSTIAPKRLGPARESAYLRWRYDDIPVFSYRILAARTAGSLEGILVFRVEPVRGRTEKVVRIVDLVCTSSAMADLLAKAVELARDAGAAMIDCISTDPAHVEALNQMHFLDALDDSHACYWVPHLFQPIDRERMRLNASWWIRGMDLTREAARGDFCLTKGDYEFDRPN